MLKCCLLGLICNAIMQICRENLNMNNKTSIEPTSEGNLSENKHKNHSVATRETSNSIASKWAAILMLSSI